MNFSEQEEKILKYWKENWIFHKTLKKDSPEGDFVFYDGPPFATGLPHYGHILASIIKDVIPRYQTMKGKRVPRKWGWDCHGLPIENLIEKELDLKSKKDIEEFGVEKFNKKAEKSVLQYTDEWKKIISRIGRWVDMEDDYRTMDASYTESVWWVFKTLHEKGLVYNGNKSMHICPRCETTLSNFEVTQNYHDIKDISVTVKFELEDEPDTFVLAWTTTPWTLPGNVALAVDSNFDYVKIKIGEEIYILAKDRLNVTEDDYEVVGNIKGKELIGKKYRPLFDYYSKDKNLGNFENGWKIYGADFVTTNEGTGVVHIAPAFGEEDMVLGQEKNLPFVQHVSINGKFKDEVKDFAGLFVKPKDDLQKTDVEVLKFLAKENKIFSKNLITHSYPFCWRCDTPLLNYATSSWFVKVTEIKDKLVKNNEKIKWVPGYLKHGRFGKWLEGARDWAISRSRYWGAPIPVWRCEKCKEIKVVGSMDEIREGLGGYNNLFITRHGESENNVISLNNSMPETKKFSLTKKGQEEAKKTALGFKNKKIDVIISSPITRAKETAEIIAKKLGVKVVLDERLREVDLGEFNNKDYHELHKVYPNKTTRAENTSHGVESGKDIKKRLEELLGELNSKYENKNIILVSHADACQILFGMMKGASLRESYEMWYPETGEVKHSYSRKIDLHRPFIDKVELGCSSTSSGQVCKGKMKRIPEVFDCWFESGSMPYGQAHYPFENKKEFEKNFPAEFIAEGVDQTRGWFYTLLVLSTALFNETAYKNVVANGIILAEGGQKMSKRLKNYPDPMYIVDKYGADSLRFYLLSSPAVHAENLNFSEKGVDEVSKKVISKIRNVVSFYEMYKEKIKFSDKISKKVLDRWIVLRLRKTGELITENLDKYRLDKASWHVALFIDDLSNWYIRRSRDRFKKRGEDSVMALNTTRYVLKEFSKLIAPFAPFVAEEVFQKVKEDDKESVHLESWPKVKRIMNDELRIMNEMEKVRQDVSVGLDSRLKAGIKVRQPLSSFKTPNKFDDDFLVLIKDELNVKEVKVGKEYKLDTKITDELKEEGMVRELTRAIQDLRKKQGLKPQDEVEMVVETDKSGEEFTNKFIEQVKKVTNVKSIKFTENDGQEVKVDRLILKLEIRN